MYQQPQANIISTNNSNNKNALDGSADIALDATLSYLNQILLEEDIDGQDVLYPKTSALYAMEKPLYDILGQKYPPPSEENSQMFQHIGTSTAPTNFGILSASKFKQGLKEGMKFLPRIDKLVLGMETKKVSLPQVPKEDDFVVLNSMGCKSIGKSKSNIDFDSLEGRAHKISTIYSDNPSRNEMLDEVVLDNANYREVASLQECIQCETSKYIENLEGFINLEALLIKCSHAVYTNDRQLAKYLINQIRELSSVDGDGTQRMALALTDALESRLNGNGHDTWRQLGRRIPASEFLKIAKLYTTVCPFPRVSSHFANQTILKVAGKTTKLHIIDFGIGLGFQWPSLIQALSSNNSKSKPLKLKITGIDFPLPGFRLASLIEATGRRLEAYAEDFGVSLEYHGIASKWEDISLGDLRIKEDEILIVNCMLRFKEVGDEAVSLDSPRNQVLKLIRQMQPHVFIHGIVNVGAYSPFFISRFKQVMVLYSSLYEVIDTVVPRDNKQRQSLERGFLAHDILNAVACEGSDWIMRPETYKQWHLRNLRAGLEQIPLDPVLLNECKEKKENFINNNIFFIDDDKNWLLLGWGGKIMFGISTWKAKLS